MRLIVAPKPRRLASLAAVYVVLLALLRSCAPLFEQPEPPELHALRAAERRKALLFLLAGAVVLLGLHSFQELQRPHPSAAHQVHR